MASNVADALDIGDRGAAKLHYKAGHGGLAGFSGRMGARDPLYGKPTRENAGIHTGEAGGPQPRLGRGRWQAVRSRGAIQASTTPRSRAFRPWPANGGTPAGRWPLWTSSMR